MMYKMNAVIEHRNANMTRNRPEVLFPDIRSPAQFWTLVYIEGSTNKSSSAVASLKKAKQFNRFHDLRAFNDIFFV